MEFGAAVAQLEALVQTLEREGDERGLLLLELVDAIHRPALERIAAGDLEHPLARALLAMYDLGPVDELVQVEEALDEVRPYVEERGGGVQVLAVQDGVVHLRLSGACTGSGDAAEALRAGVERALRDRYAGFHEVVAHEPQGGLQLPIVQVSGTAAADPRAGADNGLRRPVFADVARAGDLAPGEMRAVTAGDTSVLLLNVAGDLHALRNGCAVDGLPLEGARLTGEVLVCPWHNCAYDARSGKRVDDPGQPSLPVLPVALGDGVVRIAVDVG